MLATIRGEPTDRIPWAPRMDLWYIALRARDTVPERFAGLNTAEMADELGAACHAVGAETYRFGDWVSITTATTRTAWNSSTCRSTSKSMMAI